MKPKVGYRAGDMARRPKKYLGAPRQFDVQQEIQRDEMLRRWAEWTRQHAPRRQASPARKLINGLRAFGRTVISGGWD